MGVLKFYLICGTGALSNIGVANFAFAEGSGWFVSGLTGAFVASVFNFAMSSRYVWNGRR
jgi:dolichol-phosphate mannosyltransferase